MGSCLIQTRGKRACGAVAWSANAWAILASVASLHDRPPSTLVSLHNCSTTDVSNTLRSRGAKRSSGLLQGRYFGSTGRAARRQTGPDHHLAAGLHPRLPLPQGIPKVAGPTVSNNSSCLLFVLIVFFWWKFRRLNDRLWSRRQSGPASGPAQLAQVRPEPHLGLVPFVAEGQAPPQRRPG